MGALFGKKRSPEKTILVLDIESGSVGAALVHLSPTEAPKLFGQHRAAVPVSHSRNSDTLAHELQKAAAEVLHSVMKLAVRMRTHPKTERFGTIEHASVFLAAPWGVPNLVNGTPDFSEPLVRMTMRTLQGHVGEVPTSLHTAMGAQLHGLRQLFPEETDCFVCSVHGEITEIILLQQGRVEGYATVPVGRHSAIRTLKAHAGISHAEAQSTLRLNWDDMPPHVAESLYAAADHAAVEFASGMESFPGAERVERVYVLSHEPASQWFARALSHSERLVPLFPNGGAVRAIHSKQVLSHVASHTTAPDTLLMLGALFADRHLM